MRAYDRLLRVHRLRRVACIRQHAHMDVPQSRHTPEFFVRAEPNDISGKKCIANRVCK